MMMKKIALLALVLFCGLTTSLYAQGLGIVEVGVKGSLLVNKSELSYSNSEIKYGQNSTKPGFDAGLQLRINLPLGFLIQPEFVYSRVSGEFDAVQPAPSVGGAGTPTYDNIKIRSNWMEVPVLFGWKIAVVRIMAGPSFRFPMNETIDIKNISEKVAPRLDNFVMGYQIGVGVDLGKFTLDARYCGNFTKITDVGVTQLDMPHFQADDSKFTFSLGYMFLK